jgi:hypothetical protein|tara:strand:+ start:4286 stop:5599 length:1314 start_codon:yes stop_codon:yes gene_type:complete
MSYKYPYFDNASKVGSPYMKDYSHASNTFVRNNMRLAPKNKFLYHVVINVNSRALKSLGPSIENLLNKTEYNLLVESVDLPNFNVEYTAKNAYNRKKLVQTKINHDPIQMAFHDDNAGLTTMLWEAYYRFYYRDPNYTTQNQNGTGPDTTKPKEFSHNLYKNESVNSNRYGLDQDGVYDSVSRSYVDFFNSITVHQLHTQNGDSKFTSFTLVNPKIIDMQHDSLSYSESGTTKNTMRIAFETVLYGRGLTVPDNPAGFADPQHYDVTPSLFSANTSVGNNASATNSIIDSFLTAFFEGVIKSTLTTQNTTQNQQNLQYSGISTNSFTSNSLSNSLRIPISNQATNITQTSFSLSGSANTSLFENRSRSESLAILNTNAKALDEFSFRNVFVQDRLQSGVSGNLNTMKSSWNSLSAGAKAQYKQTALDNFDNIRRNSL